MIQNNSKRRLMILLWYFPILIVMILEMLWLNRKNSISKAAAAVRTELTTFNKYMSGAWNNERIEDARPADES